MSWCAKTKKIIAIVSSLGLLLLAVWPGNLFHSFLLASTGGPDTYGYSWKDSNEYGIKYSWLNISTDGTEWDARGNDTMSDALDIGFTFEFFGNEYTSVYICNNGYLSFSNDTCASANGLIPDSTDPDDLLAPFWDDLSTGGEIRYYATGTAPNRTFTVSWLNVDHIMVPGSDGLTFQVVLYEATQRARFNYQDVSVGNSSYNYGSSATIGAESAAGDYSLQVSRNSGYLSSSFTVQISPPRTVPRDSYGYGWWDNNDIGVNYNWSMIDMVGTTIADRTDDSMSVGIDMGFDFPFYGNYYSTVYVCNNGYLSFSNDTCAPSNGSLPSATDPDDIIAVYWDDLYTGGSIKYYATGAAPNRTFTVSWLGVNHVDAQSDSVYFQVILYETSGIIKMQYQDVGFNDENYDNGASATVGIEGASGTYGTEFSQDTASLSYSMIIQFATDPTVTQKAFRWFANADSKDVGDPLVATNARATLAADGDAFRLRLLLYWDKAGIDTGAENFTLQFAGKGTGTCASPNGTPNVYTEVTSDTAVAYKDNGSALHASLLTSNANDPVDGAKTIVNQNYQEMNDFGNTQGAIQMDQDGKWDFALYDKTAIAGDIYCFRVVTDGDVALASYAVYPSVKIYDAPKTLSFSLSDNSVGFGALDSTKTRYATGDTSGSDTEIAAHTIVASTTAASGYSITVQGDTLALANAADSITAIGGVATATSTGVEQFGLRMSASGGSGSVSAPYNDLDFKYAYAATATSPDEVAASGSLSIDTTYSVYYASNISDTTSAGAYSTTLIYVITARY